MANYRAGKPDRRGNSYQREARKRWLLATFGNGVYVPCSYCRTPLNYDQVEADRIIPGDSYVLPNVIPACRHCNASRGNRTDWRGPNPVPLRRLRRLRLIGLENYNRKVEVTL